MSTLGCRNELSQIVCKMTQKDPAQRYMNAQSVRYDFMELKRCRKENVVFHAGVMDERARFHIPDQLHGVSLSLATFARAFKSAQDGIHVRCDIVRFRFTVWLSQLNSI